MVELKKVEQGYLIQRVSEDGGVETIIATGFSEQDIRDLVATIIINFAVGSEDSYDCNETTLYRLVDLVAEECNIWEEVFIDIDSDYDDTTGAVSFIYALEQEYGASAEDLEVYSSEGIERLNNCIKDALVKVMLLDDMVITIDLD